MPKKTEPRWGDHGVTEVPDFALSPHEVHEVAAKLDITAPTDIDRLAVDLNDIGCLYLRWHAQDEEGPSRAERNAALGEVVETSRQLELLLKALDHASEAVLIDALAPYRSLAQAFDDKSNLKDTTECRELGFRQIQALRDRLAHFNRSAAAMLKRQRRQKGPEPKKTLPAIVDMLADVYESETGNPPTHTPFDKTEYKSVPQSPAGRFIAAFLKIVDPSLPPSTVSSALAQVVKQRKAGTKRVRPPSEGHTS